MADQVLTIVYNTTTGVVSHSGLTSNALPDVIKKLLMQHGIDFSVGGPLQGRLNDRSTFNAAKRGQIIRKFNGRFDQDPNPYHATDNITLVFTAA